MVWPSKLLTPMHCTVHNCACEWGLNSQLIQRKRNLFQTELSDIFHTFRSDSQCYSRLQSVFCPKVMGRRKSLSLVYDVRVERWKLETEHEERGESKINAIRYSEPVWGHRQCCGAGLRKRGKTSVRWMSQRVFHTVALSHFSGISKQKFFHCRTALW